MPHNLQPVRGRKPQCLVLADLILWTIRVGQVLNFHHGHLHRPLLLQVELRLKCDMGVKGHLPFSIGWGKWSYYHHRTNIPPPPHLCSAFEMWQQSSIFSHSVSLVWHMLNWIKLGSWSSCKIWKFSPVMVWIGKSQNLSLATWVPDTVRDLWWTLLERPEWWWWDWSLGSVVGPVFLLRGTMSGRQWFVWQVLGEAEQHSLSLPRWWVVHNP